MAYSNANYLLPPNRLSTKVHYAPGGASSLSLAWDDPPPKKPQPIKLNVNEYKYKTEPPLPKNVNSYLQKIKQEQQMNKRYFEPQKSGYIDLSQSNRLLEEQLRYYQNRNKIFRSRLFGNIEGQPLAYSIPAKNEHIRNYSEHYPLNSLLNYSSDYSEYSNDIGRNSQSLDIAVQEQHKRRLIQREASRNQNYSINNFQPEKPSIKVSNPPGGRSSIVFG